MISRCVIGVSISISCHAFGQGLPAPTAGPGVSAEFSALVSQAIQCVNVHHPGTPLPAGFQVRVFARNPHADGDTPMATNFGADSDLDGKHDATSIDVYELEWCAFGPSLGLGPSQVSSLKTSAAKSTLTTAIEHELFHATNPPPVVTPPGGGAGPGAVAVHNDLVLGDAWCREAGAAESGATAACAAAAVSVDPSETAMLCGLFCQQVALIEASIAQCNSHGFGCPPYTDPGYQPPTCPECPPC
ncbi:MAG: hypothetical protein ACF8XB_09835 [Planctomycetota bacterium JB042]